MAPDRRLRDVLRDVEGADVKRGSGILRQFFAKVAGARQYDEACRQGLERLWARVKDDGCVMTNPLNGQLEGTGWTVYVQLGDRGQDFIGPTLLGAIEIAHRKVADW